MRIARVLLLTALASATASAAAAATSPQLAQKRAQARLVVSEINRIDERLNAVSERFDGARVRLESIYRRLQIDRRALAGARDQDRRAQAHAASLLVSLYVSDRPTALEVLIGTHTLSDLVTLSDAETAISREIASVAATARETRRQLKRELDVVQTERAAAQRTVGQLARARTEIERGLRLRRTLLASVEGEISRLEAQQRARQARLAAEARARLAAEARARIAADAAARARAVASARAQAAARVRAAATRTAKARPTPAEPTAAPATTQPPVATAATESTTTTPTPPSAPAQPPAPLDNGHPSAASIALQYIGVPYVWGGASPSGFDCSGLVTYVFQQLGIDLPHFAADQYGYGSPVSRDQLQPGDLVFFDSLNHVGIYIGSDQYVDAPDTGSFVRIDSLDSAWSSANYVGARRI